MLNRMNVVIQNVIHIHINDGYDGMGAIQFFHTICI